MLIYLTDNIDRGRMAVDSSLKIAPEQMRLPTVRHADTMRV